MRKELIVGVFLCLLSCLFVTNGVLLLLRPVLFLRFNDWLNRGPAFKTARWRKDVYNPEWRALGVFFLLIGIWGVILLIKLLLKTLGH